MQKKSMYNDMAINILIGIDAVPLTTGICTYVTSPKT